MVDINDYLKNTGIGAGANRRKIDASGTVKLEGGATYWDDIAGPLSGAKLGSAAGSAAYNYNENSVEFAANGSITNANDRVFMSVQLPHGVKPDSLMKFHMHWEQTDAVVRTMTLRYRIQDNSEAKVTAWTTVAVDTDDSIYTYVSGTINNILPIVAIDLTGVGLSAVVQLQFTRTDGGTGVLAATSLDAHVERDQEGSDQEYVR